MTKVTAGRLVSVVIYYQPSAADDPATRAAKQRASSEARARINRRYSWQKLEALLAEPQRREHMAAAALELVREGRGAVERTLAVVRPDLPGERAGEA